MRKKNVCLNKLVCLTNQLGTRRIEDLRLNLFEQVQDIKLSIK